MTGRPQGIRGIRDVVSESGSGIRYALASVAALAVDFVLTLGLHALTPLPLYACAAISFVAVGVAFYFVHEHWTFRAEGSRTSATRLGKNLFVLACAFTGRVATIAALELLHAPDGILSVVYFGAGAGVSFTINFVVNKLWVFASR